MLHHVAVPHGARLGVDQLVNEGNLLDGIDSVQMVFDPHAVLLELRGDGLPPVDGVVARAELRVLQV